MDPIAFDTLARSFVTPGSRRRLLGRVLAALPLAGALGAWEDEPGTSVAHPVERIQKRRRHHHHKGGSLGCSQCEAGETCCGGNCTSLASDSDNCGACGNACPALGMCTGGRCCVLPLAPNLPSNCSATLPCCAGTCVGGTCCLTTGAPCTGNGDSCCGGCSNGACT